MPNDATEQHALSNFSDFNNRARPLSALLLQAQDLKPPPFTDTERLEFIAEHFSGLDFGRSQDPDKQSAYIQPMDEGFTAMHAPKGELRFRIAGEGDFREVLDALMKVWK